MKNTKSKPVSFYNEYHLTTYYLCGKTVELRNHFKPFVYFFSKDKKYAVDKIPDGYEVVESPVSKMFFLRKKGGRKKKHVKVIQ